MTGLETRKKKPLHWISSSYDDLVQFPAHVRKELGRALTTAQYNGKHPSAKPWKGLGPGVLEIVENYDGNAYRAIYTVRFRHAVYVLHVFQKKSPSGIRTARNDIQLIRSRMKIAERDYEKNYAEENR